MVGLQILRKIRNKTFDVFEDDGIGLKDSLGILKASFFRTFESEQSDESDPNRGAARNTGTAVDEHIEVLSVHQLVQLNDCLEGGRAVSLKISVRDRFVVIVRDTAL